MVRLITGICRRLDNAELSVLDPHPTILIELSLLRASHTPYNICYEHASGYCNYCKF
jgi:hypothetical protein